jgi:cytochrome c5
MSDAHDSHTGPIKTPKQLLWVAVLGFVVPVFLIIGLVFYVTKADLPLPTTMDPELATAKRIQPIGSVAIRDGNRVLQPGDAVYRAQCAACHDAGLVGAPMFGSAGDWTARISQGLDVLVNHTLQGKGAMGPQGGGAFSDLEIARAVVFLANAGGASFEEPAAPAPTE